MTTKTVIEIQYIDEKTGEPRDLLIGSESPNLDSGLEEVEARCALIRSLRAVRNADSITAQCEALNAFEESSRRLSMLLGEDVRSDDIDQWMIRTGPDPHNTLADWHGLIAWSADEGLAIRRDEHKFGTHWELVHLATF